MSEDHNLVAARLKEQLLQGREPLRGASQSAEDLECWEEFFDSGRLAPKSSWICELGTGSGAFTRWLRDNYPGKIVSFDHQSAPIRTFLTTYIVHDILNNPKQVIEVLERFSLTTLLFCDNGDKPKEVELFSPYLKKGDYLAVHDYGVEIHSSDIPDKFEPVLIKGLTAFFIKI